MRIIKMDIKSYLKTLGCTEEEIEKYAPMCEDEESLNEVLHTFDKDYICSCDAYDLYELIDLEDMYLKSGLIKHEYTYVYVLDKFWETDEN